MRDIEFVLSVSYVLRVYYTMYPDFAVHQQVLHRVQQIMSGESAPSLSGAIPAFKMFMTSWEEMAQKHPNLKPLIEPGLEWATMYYNQMDGTRAYVIAICK